MYAMLVDFRAKLAVGVVVFLAAGLLLWWAYGNHRIKMNESAQVTFASHLELFIKTRTQEITDPAVWQNVADQFARGYAEYQSADIAPLFLAFQAEAVARSGSVEQAIALLEKMLQDMTSGHPFYYLYKIKMNLLRLEVPKPEVAAEGNRELEELARDPKNPHKGLAWYHIWHAAWVNQDEDRAQSSYSQLMMYQNQGAQWGALAQAQMEFLA